jgi:hypothetical protein
MFLGADCLPCCKPFKCDSPEWTGCPGRIDYRYGPVFSDVPQFQEIIASRQTYEVPLEFSGPVEVRFCGGGDDGIAINGVRKTFFGQPVPASAFLTLQPGQTFTVSTWNDSGPAAAGATICFFELNPLP